MQFCHLPCHEIPVVNFFNILQAAFEPIFFCQKIQRQTVIRENLQKSLSNKKGARKMMMKLTPVFSKV